MIPSNNIYGVISSDNVHTDISRSLKGTKRYATINGYDKVSIRYNAGYNVDIVATKINGKWRVL